MGTIGTMGGGDVHILNHDVGLQFGGGGRSGGLACHVTC